MSVKSPNNVAIEQALVAVARAQTLLPGFDRTKAIAIATALELLLAPERTLEGTFATAVVLLRLIGYNARDALAAASAESATRALGKPRS